MIHLSFEGPDRYSSAGGLGVRVVGLAEAIAATGLVTDLYFVGDPELPGVEQRGGVTLHRWCQAISARAPAGVYDAEEDKIADLCTWWPRHTADRIAEAASTGTHTVVLAEDWQTAWPLIGLHDELVGRGLRGAATLAWTANNRFGFERIDFARLERAARILTISRAMKHLLWGCGVNPCVVPNGLPPPALRPVDPVPCRVWTDCFAGVTTLAKVGRWHPDKRWPMAVSTVAALEGRGERAVLVARGWDGSRSGTSHRGELRDHATALGLDWVVVDSGGETGPALARAVQGALPDGGGVVEVAYPVAGETLRALYAGVDAVLANSGFEPFGLVGLEAMAVGSLLITGSTGEDYLAPFVNGIALDTDDPHEIVRALDWIRREPGRAERLREAAVATARQYSWAAVIERLWMALGLPAAPPTI